MPDPIRLDDLLACPRCAAAPLTPGADRFRCQSCAVELPILDGLPWLFPEPAATLAEWRGRLHLLLQHLEREASLHRRELDRKGLHPLTRERLARTAAACEDHGGRLRALLAPLGLDARQARYEVNLALGTQLPSTQGLTSYYANVHRDWAWGRDENAASLEVVARELEPGGMPGRVLVLGAGAGRLAYDLHQTTGTACTVALDFNPLLATVGRRACAGEPIELYEFPIAPRTIADHAVLRRLVAPTPARAGLHFVLADALAAPFRPEAFDLVLTPWFVDIVPDDLTALMRRLNRVLEGGGRWLLFGSLAWADRPPSACYSLEELQALATDAGFETGAAHETPMPYMRSPASRHSRVESVISAVFHKRRTVEVPPRPEVRPSWLDDPDAPVPALPEFREQSLSTRVYAFIMAMIDGRRTIRDMAALMEEQKLMLAADAEPAIRSFLARMVDDARRRANF